MRQNCWDSGDLWVGLTVSALVEAVSRVAVTGEDHDAVATLLQADGGVDDKALSAADSEIWVEEDGGAGGGGRRRHRRERATKRETMQQQGLEMLTSLVRRRNQ